MPDFGLYGREIQFEDDYEGDEPFAFLVNSECSSCGAELPVDEMSEAVEGKHAGYLVCDDCLED